MSYRRRAGSINPRMPTSALRSRSGSRSWLKPPAPVGVFESSTVVGVSYAVAKFVYRLSVGVAATVRPTDGLAAPIVRSPD